MEACTGEVHRIISYATVGTQRLGEPLVLWKRALVEGVSRATVMVGYLLRINFTVIRLDTARISNS